MRRPVALGLVALGLLVLAACQRTEDPARAGFFSGLANTVSGTYEQRIDQKQQELSETERMKQSLARRADEAERDRAQSDAALKDRQLRLAAMDDQLQRMERQLDQLRAQRSGDRVKLADAERRVAALKQQRAQADPADDAQVRQLDQQVQTLGRAINGLSRVE